MKFSAKIIVTFVIIAVSFTPLVSGKTLFGASSELTSAIERADEILEDPGMIPGDLFYFIKEWSEWFTLLFTFNEESKAELEHEYALRRLSEVQILLDEGEDEKAEEHLTKYASQIEKLGERLKKLQDNDEFTAEHAEIFTYVYQHQSEVLEEVYDEVSDDSQELIANSHEGLWAAYYLEANVSEVTNEKKAAEKIIGGTITEVTNKQTTTNQEIEYPSLPSTNVNAELPVTIVNGSPSSIYPDEDDDSEYPIRTSHILNTETIVLSVGQSEDVFGMTITLDSVGNGVATIIPVMGSVRGNSNPGMLPEKDAEPEEFGVTIVLRLNHEVVMENLYVYYLLTHVDANKAVIDVYFKANTKATIVLHRTMRDCATEAAVKDEYGREEQMFTVGTGSGYYNYTCKNRFEEQCEYDGSFDIYYDEWCERINMSSY